MRRYRYLMFLQKREEFALVEGFGSQTPENKQIRPGSESGHKWRVPNEQSPALGCREAGNSSPTTNKESYDDVQIS